MSGSYRNRLLSGFLLASLGLAALTILACGACRSQKEKRDEVPTRDINAVMADHTAELMAIPGVTGVAIGETENKTPCILVLVVEKTDELARNIPKVIEGHPVRLMVSGIIRPMKNE